MLYFIHLQKIWNAPFWVSKVYKSSLNFPFHSSQIKTLAKLILSPRCTSITIWSNLLFYFPSSYEFKTFNKAIVNSIQCHAPVTTPKYQVGLGSSFSDTYTNIGHKTCSLVLRNLAHGGTNGITFTTLGILLV